MKSLSKDQVKILFENQTKKNYKKRGNFLWRIPQEKETVLTIVAGKLETLNVARPFLDVIIRNIQIGSSAETYIIDKDIFNNRYISKVDINHRVFTLPVKEISFNDIIFKANLESVWHDGNIWYMAEAKGKVKAFCYHGETIEFVAPWDEKMLCEDGDYIASPLDGDPNDIYRIEKQAFAQNYIETEI